MIPIESKLTKNAVLVFGSIFFMQSLFIVVLYGFVEYISWRVERERAATQVIRAIASTEMQSLIALHYVYKNFLNAIHREKHNLERLKNEKAWIEFPKTMNALHELVGDGPGNEHVSVMREYTNLNIPKTARRLIKLRERFSDLTEVERLYNDFFDHADSLTSIYEQLERDAGDDLSEVSFGILGFIVVAGLAVNIGIAFALYNRFFSDITKRFERIFEDINTIGSGKPVPELSQGNDEIDMLAAELHEIAANVQRFQSNEKVMFDHASSVVCSIDNSFVIISVGRGSAAQLGFDSTSLVGMHFTELPFFDVSCDLEEELEKLFAERVDIEFDSTLTKPSGDTIDLSWKARLSEDGETAVLVGHDVTELSTQIRTVRQRQEEFRNIIDRMPIAVVTTGESFVISSINQATSDMFKCVPTDLLGKDLGVLLTGGSAGGAQLREIAKVAEAQPVELSVRSFADDKIPAEFSMRSYSNRYAKKTYLATFRDISARTEIENVKRDFVSMISHDLRSPLTALFGTLEILVEGGNFKTQADAAALRNATTIVANLVNLINDFLDLEKFEAGLGVLELREVSLEELVNATLDADELCDLQINVTPDTQSKGAVVKVDRARTVFAIAHFVSLVKRHASPDAKLRIWLSVEQSNALVTITGDGFHLPPETREASLSRYAYVPSVSDETVESSGLALALSRAIIQAHNGRLRFDADVNLESVTIELPLV